MSRPTLFAYPTASGAATTLNLITSQQVVNLLGTGNTVTWGANLYPGTDQGSINGALFRFGSLGTTVGNLDVFLRLSKGGVERGYNTSARPLVFDESSSGTHALRLYEIPVVRVGDVDYFQFKLDISEPNNSRDRYLSLDELRIYTHPVEPSVPPSSPASLGTLRYDLDAGNVLNRVLLDGNRTPVSGASSMEMLVPVSDFHGLNSSEHVFLYALLGELGQSTTDVNPPAGPNNASGWGSGGGAEDWGVITQASNAGGFYFPPDTVIPEPRTAVWVTTLGLLGLGAIVRRRAGAATSSSGPVA